jgi:hypothetical protein
MSRELSLAQHESIDLRSLALLHPEGNVLLLRGNDKGRDFFCRHVDNYPSGTYILLILCYECASADVPIDYL